MDEEARAYTLNLNYTLAELQKLVQEHQFELEELQSTHTDTPDTPLSPEAQAAIITQALQHVANSEPLLPAPSSVLPALLALRKTHETIVQSEAHIASQGAETQRVKRQLEAERAHLKEQHLLADALKARLESLRTAQPASPTETTPDDRAAKLRKTLEARKNKYDSETSKLMRSLLAFIDDHLAVMLAAEELGGPVVGDAVDLDPNDLAAGFNTRGKPSKRAKKTSDNLAGRQQRIDEIWGTGDNDSAPDEVAAAGLEMRQLTEDLLNTLVEAKGDNSESYVQLTRESAAARFLVRSKVAQFHPKDATRLRLIDFGRELAT